MSNRTAVPTQFAGERPTDRQCAFIRGLIHERKLEGLSVEQRDYLQTEYDKPMEQQFLGCSVAKASKIIDTMLKLPVTDKVVQKQNPGLPDVPAGRYAVENDEGELRFYRLWIGKNGYKKLYVLFGPNEGALPYKTALSILGKIFRAGVEECAVRFGHEIGACSNCGRRLTNRISRELGIGPICGGRMFGDEFDAKKAKARENILARGEDPDEEVEDAQA
jgi:hypothetical protein